MRHFDQTIVKTYRMKFQIFTEYLHTFVNSRKIRFSCSVKEYSKAISNTLISNDLVYIGNVG